MTGEDAWEIIRKLLIDTSVAQDNLDLYVIVFNALRSYDFSRGHLWQDEH